MIDRKAKSEPGDASALCVKNCVLKLNLHALMGNNTPSKESILRTYLAMVWLKSLSGFYYAPTRNMVCGTTLIIFVGFRNDVCRLDCISSDPCEHQFAMLRQKVREFASSQMIDLIDCTLRRAHWTLKRKFQWSDEESKGHQETMKRHFMKETHEEI